MSAAVTVYSMAACPYAQRTRILLALKGIAHRLVELDLTRPRPEWFLALNPAGKVPVIEHAGRVLAESSVINEYLEDAFPEPPAMPAEPHARAQVRLLVQFCNERFAPNLYRALMEQDAARRARVEAQAAADWVELEALLERTGGGSATPFGLAEATFAPFFARYGLTDHYWGAAPWRQAGLARVLAWRERCLAHPAVAATSLPAEHYVKLYEDYAWGYSNGRVPPGRTRSSFDLAVPLEARPLPAPRTAGSAAASTVPTTPA